MSHARSAVRYAVFVDVSSESPGSSTTEEQQVIIRGDWVANSCLLVELQLAVLGTANECGRGGAWQRVWQTQADSPACCLPNVVSLYGCGCDLAVLHRDTDKISNDSAILTSGPLHQGAFCSVKDMLGFHDISSYAHGDGYLPPFKFACPEYARTDLQPNVCQNAGLNIGFSTKLGAACGLFGLYQWYARRQQRREQRERGYDLQEKRLRLLALTVQRDVVRESFPGVDDQEDRLEGADADHVEPDVGSIADYYLAPRSPSNQRLKYSHVQDAEEKRLPQARLSLDHVPQAPLNDVPGCAINAFHIPWQLESIEELEEDERNLGAEKTLSNSLLANLEQWTAAAPTAAHQLNTIPANRISVVRSSSCEQTSPTLSDLITLPNLSPTSSHSNHAIPAPLYRAVDIAAAHTSPCLSPNAASSHGGQLQYRESEMRTPADLRKQFLTMAHGGDCANTSRSQSARYDLAGSQTDARLLLRGKFKRIGSQDRPNSDVFWPRAFFGVTRESNNNARTNAGTNAGTTIAAQSRALNTSRPHVAGARNKWWGSVRQWLQRSDPSVGRARSFAPSPSYHKPLITIVPPLETLVDDGRRSPLRNAPPRRDAASIVSSWRRRRGKQDWEEGEEERRNRNSSGDLGDPANIDCVGKGCQRQGWTEPVSWLADPTFSDEIPASHISAAAREQGVDIADRWARAITDDGDWNIEAAVEYRAVQGMFTVPKSKLRVVNADPAGSSNISLPCEDSEEGQSFLADDVSRIEVDGEVVNELST